MIGYKTFRHRSEFDAIADKEIQVREEEQLDYLTREIDEIRKLLGEIKERQASTRGLVDTFKGADYNLEAVYERARQWRHSRDDWSREYTPTPPPIQSSTINASEKSFLEELEEAGDTMDPVEEANEEGEEEEVAAFEVDASAADKEAVEEAAVELEEAAAAEETVEEAAETSAVAEETEETAAAETTAEDQADTGETTEQA